MNDAWLLLILVLAILLIVASGRPTSEGFEVGVHLEDADVYDDNYAKIYDVLFSVPERMKWELERIKAHSMAKTAPVNLSFLELYSATGKYASLFEDLTNKYTGLDPSVEFLAVAESNAKNAKFKQGDPKDPTIFPEGQFSHVLVMNYGIYKSKDPKRIIRNAAHWLKPDGWLILHAVDPDKFDPILDAASPFPAFSPQKYSDERIIDSEIVFDKFTYKSKFIKRPDSWSAKFEETIIYPNEKARRHTQNLTMPPKAKLVEYARLAGLTPKKSVDMVACMHEYQHLLFFQK